MAEDRILFALHDKTCFIKLVGEATYIKTAGFGCFINDLFSHEQIDDVLVDLSGTTYIDSTNLGELAKIAAFLRQQNSHRPTVVCTDTDMSEMMTGLGLNRLFVMVDETREPGVAMSELPEITLDERENAERILEAHRYLMSVNDRTGRVFRSVVDAFERDLGRDDNGQPD